MAIGCRKLRRRSGCSSNISTFRCCQDKWNVHGIWLMVNCSYKVSYRIRFWTIIFNNKRLSYKAQAASLSRLNNVPLIKILVLATFRIVMMIQARFRLKAISITKIKCSKKRPMMAVTMANNKLLMWNKVWIHRSLCIKLMIVSSNSCRIWTQTNKISKKWMEVLEGPETLIRTYRLPIRLIWIIGPIISLKRRKMVNRCMFRWKVMKKKNSIWSIFLK